MEAVIEKRKKINWKIVLGALVVLLIIGRILLPGIIRDKINDYLENDMESYTGHIDDFDLSLWRGAYQIEELVLRKKGVKKGKPFVEIENMDISVSWKALFKGKFLVDLEMDKPRVNFTDSHKKEKKQLGVENKPVTWVDLTKTLVPFNLESWKIHRGEIHFINTEPKVPVDIFFNSIELEAYNIHNSQKAEKKLFSNYKVTAQAQKNAQFNSKGTFNIIKDPPDFDMSMTLEKFDVTKLNPFLKGYIPVDMTSGKLNLYMELASFEGQLKGYVKPLIKDLDVVDSKNEKDDSFKEFALEILSALGNLILRNGQNKTVATKIPIEGKMTAPDLDYGKAIGLAIDNAFGKPEVFPKLDNEINLESAKKEKKKEDKKKKKK